MRSRWSTVYALPATAADGGLTAGALLSTVTTVTEVDGYGNPTNITVTTEDHANSKRFQQETVNRYGSASDNWGKQFGRVRRTEVTRRRDEANDGTYEASALRTAAFSYYTTKTLRGLLKTETRAPFDDRLKHVTTYSYDRFGNRVGAKVRAAKGATAAARATRCRGATVAYGAYGRYVEAEKDCLGRLRQRLGGYNAYGQPAWSERLVVQDGAAVRTAYSYTAGGRLYFTRDATGAYTGTRQADCGSGCPGGAAYYTETRQAGGGVRRDYRDVLARAVRSAVQGFDGTWIHTDTEYDFLGRVARRSEPYYAGDTRYWTGYSYDLLGRVVRTTLPDYVAGSGGGDSVVTVRYAGLVTTTTNGKGQRRVQTRTALGEVLRTADHAGTTVAHGYDVWGQVLHTTTTGAGVDPVAVKMGYDGRGRRAWLDDPDRGRWTYAYNGFDELVRQTDAVGNVQALAYDGLGRLVRRQEYTPGTATAADVLTGDVLWKYDAEEGAASENHGLGRLVKVADRVSGYLRKRHYDRLGRPAGHSVTLGRDGTYRTRQTYDGYGRPWQTFDAARRGLRWGDNVTALRYNGQGYAYQWEDGVQANNRPRATYRTITAQDARGNVTGETLGGGAIRSGRVFDTKTGRIGSITSADVLARQVQALTYEWDLVGNLTERGETSVGKMLTEAFTYDTLNRLTSAQVTGRTAQAVSYDALGNITCKSDVDGTDCTRARARNYRYGTGTRTETGTETGTETTTLLGPHAVVRAGNLNYTYDANGNRLTGAGRTLGYTAFNKVKTIDTGTTSTGFAYGPDRSRTKRTDTVSTGTTTSTTTTLYIGNVEKVIAPGGRYTWKRYLAGGAVLVEQDHDSTHTRTAARKSYLLRDHLGSIDVITNAAGTVEQDMSFDAWGQRRAAPDWTVLALLRLTDTAHGRTTTRGFTGHEMLDAHGIIHMNGRIYDPKLGRFMQADPVIQFPDYSQSWNRYSYVLNNPLNATDPTGYFIGKLFRKLVGIALHGVFLEALFSKIPQLRHFSTLAVCLSGNPAQCGIAAAGNAYAGGASLKRALKAGIFSYVSAQAFTAVGDYFQAIEATGGIGHLGAHALTGGVLAELQGGEFGHGFLSAGVAFGVGQIGIKQGWSVGAQFVSRVVSAGTVSEITGGKFANGAVTAAFAYVYNEAVHGTERERTPKKIGEVHGRGDSLEFEGGNEIKVEPYSHTQGADAFTYEVDYRFVDAEGNERPMAIPLDRFSKPKPAYYGNAITGFGAGIPDRTFIAPSPYYDRVQWRITIPHQAINHQNSAGWHLRVYEVE